MKSRAFSWRAIDLDTPTVVIANPLNYRKPYAQSFSLRRTAEEPFVEQRQIGRFYSYARIWNGQPPIIKFDPDITFLSILHSITN